MTETLYHITVLSNFARGFDKYSRSYSKIGIPQSTFADRFYLLRRDELGIGIEKATPLLAKLGLDGNRLIALETQVDAAKLHPNPRNGRGRYIESNRIPLSQVHKLEMQGDATPRLREASMEDAMSESLRLLRSQFTPFARIRPRAISFLPIALACPAKCPFCFSKASVSTEQAPAKPDWQKIGLWLKCAHEHGAERAVITGGGEPTLLPRPSLVALVESCAATFDKVVLITNGHVLADGDPTSSISGLYRAGLRVLAISRHLHDSARSEQLMGLDTPVESLISTWRENRELWPELRLRLICVLQKGGVEDNATLEQYISWASGQGVEEICFKELYVSTSVESVYHDRLANDWSRQHQVPLPLLTEFLEQAGFTVESRLPWGAPVYVGQLANRPLRIAAYTEPSLFWERTRGIARSWNVMADGRCYVSLEDRASEIEPEHVA